MKRPDPEALIGSAMLIALVLIGFCAYASLMENNRKYEQDRWVKESRWRAACRKEWSDFECELLWQANSDEARAALLQQFKAGRAK